MQKLKIENIGPIVFVDIQLNKVNLIMGPQSSGKSTILKIACFCHWVEKRVSMLQSFDFFLQKGKLEDSLVTFHKLDGYIREDSSFEYESDILKIVFKKSDALPHFEWKDQYAYRHNKISYIPAERNLVATIPNWLEVKFSDNNIRNFMADWSSARETYTKDESFEIPSLNARYYFHQKNDYIEIGQDQILEFTNTSSGIQSVTPLMVLIKYFTDWIYKNDIEESVGELKQRQEIGISLHKKEYEGLKSQPIKIGKTLQAGILFAELDEVAYIFPDDKTFQEFEERVKTMTRLQFTNLFIEEPESNLFPTTQRDLLYYMLRAINIEHDHHLFITTHSPYILNALNNCMMGHLVKDVISDESKEKLASRNSWICPEQVSAWQIKDGYLVDIKTSRLNTIGEHYFNETMNEVLNEYYVMLKYIGRS